MRHIFFLLLVAVGLVSIVIGVAMAFVTPTFDNSRTITCTGTLVPYGAESKAGEGVSAVYVDERGYLPIIVGAGLLSVAFLSRKRK